MAITIAGQGDIRQRLNNDGLAALGLAGAPALARLDASTPRG